MEYNSLHDIARRKAALEAELQVHAKQIAQLKRQLLAPAKKGKKEKGLLGKVAPFMSFSTMFTAFDGAFFAWKLYRRFKKK